MDLLQLSLFLNFCFSVELLYPKIKNYLLSKKNKTN